MSVNCSKVSDSLVVFDYASYRANLRPQLSSETQSKVDTEGFSPEAIRVALGNLTPAEQAVVITERAKLTQHNSNTDLLTVLGEVDAMTSLSAQSKKKIRDALIIFDIATYKRERRTNDLSAATEGKVDTEGFSPAAVNAAYGPLNTEEIAANARLRANLTDRTSNADLISILDQAEAICLPPAPTTSVNLPAVDATGKVTFEWEYAAADQTNFHISAYSIQVAPEATPINWTASGVQTFRVTNPDARNFQPSAALPPGRYFWRIAAENSYGQGNFALDTRGFGTNINPPNSVRNQRVVELTANKIKVTWQPPQIDATHPEPVRYHVALWTRADWNSDTDHTHSGIQPRPGILIPMAVDEKDVAHVSGTALYAVEFTNRFLHEDTEYVVEITAIRNSESEPRIVEIATPLATAGMSAMASARYRAGQREAGVIIGVPVLRGIGDLVDRAPWLIPADVRLTLGTSDTWQSSGGQPFTGTTGATTAAGTGIRATWMRDPLRLNPEVGLPTGPFALFRFDTMTRRLAFQRGLGRDPGTAADTDVQLGGGFSWEDPRVSGAASAGYLRYGAHTTSRATLDVFDLRRRGLEPTGDGDGHADILRVDLSPTIINRPDGWGRLRLFGAVASVAEDRRAGPPQLYPNLPDQTHASSFAALAGAHLETRLGAPNRSAWRLVPTITAEGYYGSIGMTRQSVSPDGGGASSAGLEGGPADSRSVSRDFDGTAAGVTASGTWEISQAGWRRRSVLNYFRWLPESVTLGGTRASESMPGLETTGHSAWEIRLNDILARGLSVSVGEDDAQRLTAFAMRERQTPIGVRYRVPLGPVALTFDARGGPYSLIDGEDKTRERGYAASASLYLDLGGQPQSDAGAAVSERTNPFYLLR